MFHSSGISPNQPELEGDLLKRNVIAEQPLLRHHLLFFT